MYLINMPPTPPLNIAAKFVSFKRALFILIVIFLVSGWYSPTSDSVGSAHAADLKNEVASILTDADIVSATDLHTFNAFVRSVQNGNPRSLVGVYIPGQWGFPITQQPASNPGFVSANSNVVTQFSLAAQYNTIGLLAHNYLAGSNFFELYKYKRLALVYGDGSVEYYLIKEINRYRALSPNSPYSSFEDLQEPGTIISVTDLFNRIYAPGNRLVLQTCIEANGNLSWGRLFISATAMEYPEKISYNYRSDKFRLD